MEDKTGIFTPPQSENTAYTPKLNENISEKEALAAILGGRPSYAGRTSNNSASSMDSTRHFNSPVSGAGNSPDKTTVIDAVQTGAFTPSFPDNNKAVKIDEPDEDFDNYDNSQPYYIENTMLKKSEKKRKKNLIREQRIRALNALQSRKTFTHIFGSVLLTLFIISVSIFLSYFIVRVTLDFTGITTNEFEIEVEIPENSTTEEIADILETKGLITMPGFFTFYSGLTDADGGYRGGDFILESSMTYGTLIRTLQSVDNQRDSTEVIFPEGITAEDIGKLLEEKFVCYAADFEEFYKTKQNAFGFEMRVMEDIMKFNQLEGYLFPDTYTFFVVDAIRDGKEPENMTDAERETMRGYARVAANKFYDNFNEKITPEMYKAMNEMGLNLDELITLASMVEAEAATEEDMKLVASVFLNRLNNSDIFPYLQSDPTGYYADNFIRPHITQRNASRYEPIAEAYDTYLRPGLPPGAIGNPGLLAINAVLNAPRSDYFYFCANIDTKEVFYATTLVEHEANLAMVAEQMRAAN